MVASYFVRNPQQVLALREDLSIEDSCTAYLGMLLIPYNLGVVMDIVHQGHQEMFTKTCLRAMQDKWYQIVCNQNSKLLCLAYCQQWLVRL